MFYYSILIFTVNDVGTTALIERAFVAFMGILCSIVNANIFGIITLLIQDMRKKDIIFQTEMDNIVTAMTTLELPRMN